MSESQERNPRCPRCGGALKFDTCIVGGDEMYAVEDEAVCMNCSRRFAQPRFAAGFRDIPIATVRGNSGTYYKSEEPRKRRDTKPCRVDGCAGRVVLYSKSGICAVCAKAQHIWDKSLHTTPPPFVPHPASREMLVRNPARSRGHVG